MTRQDEAPVQAGPDSLDAVLESAWSIQYSQPHHSHERAKYALELARKIDDMSAIAKALLCIGYYQLRYAVPDEAEATLQEAARLFSAADDKRGLVLASNGLARLQMMRGDAQGALAVFLNNLAKTDPSITALDRFFTLNGLAGCYWVGGDWSRSLAHSFEALGLLRGLDANHQLAVLLTNLGGQLVDVGDYQAANELLTEAWTIAEHFSHPHLKLELRANLAQCLIALDKPLEALPHAREIAATDQLQALSAADAGMLHAAAETFIAISAWKEAMTCLDRSADIGAKFESQDVRAVNTWLRGLLAYRKGLVHDALPLLKSAALQIEGTQLLTVKCKLFQLLANACAEAGDFHAGYRYQQQHFKHHDKRLDISARARYYALQIRYELAALSGRNDEGERTRIQSELAQAELDALNRALRDKMRQIEELKGQLRDQAAENLPEAKELPTRTSNG
jgi:tetratricopeptide (TPR) repeat protein